MKRYALIFFWLVLVALFTGYGFFGPGFEGQTSGCPFYWDVAWSEALYCGGIGFSIATCVVGGIYTILQVRDGSLSHGFGLIMVLFWSCVGAILPPVFMSASGLFHGETGMMIIDEAMLTILTGILGSVAFTVVILFVRPKLMPQRAIQLQRSPR